MLVLRVVLALVCVIALIWVAGRRLGGAQARRGRPAPEMHVLARQSFGRHSGVAVLAVGNRRLLLGYGDQQVTMLTELAPVLDGAPSPSSALTHPTAAPAARPSTGGAQLSAVPSPRAELDIDAVLAQARIDAQAPPRVPGSAPAGPAPTGAADPTDPAAAPGPLDGSVLSPATWRRAVGALQDRTVRR
ncbi:flagellar biosynthetic protein FliO [Cellulomonas sp. P22]|uniref:flagellar biosynthetic protein FliO n=1 Tax=Cellulomonas sp. P22 TaxID=3373189 RepID=UPI0037BFB329